MLKFVIIGAGIGGLTAAIALRQRGIDAQVFEKTPTLHDVGAGIALWPNAVKVLRKLGLDEHLAAISLTNVDGAIRRSTGYYLARTLAAELQRRFGGGMVILHRKDLLEVLAGTVGHDNIHFDHALSNLSVSENVATFANGFAVKADAFIGADGLHSVVRSQLGHTDQPVYSGYTAWRAVVSFPRSGFVPAETWGRGKRFGAFPVQGDRVYWFATCNATAGERNPPDGAQAHLLSLFKGWHEPIEALIRAADDACILRNDIYDRDPSPTWGQGRVTLLGDAAHPMTPNLGQGACQAIEDAWQLAACLSTQSDVAAALNSYETRRIKRTTPILLSSRRIGAFAQLENSLLCTLRDTAVRLTPDSVTYRSLESVIGYDATTASTSLH